MRSELLAQRQLVTTPLTWEGENLKSSLLAQRQIVTQKTWEGERVESVSDVDLSQQLSTERSTVSILYDGLVQRMFRTFS